MHAFCVFTARPLSSCAATATLQHCRRGHGILRSGLVWHRPVIMPRLANADGTGSFGLVAIGLRTECVSICGLPRVTENWSSLSRSSSVRQCANVTRDSERSRNFCRLYPRRKKQRHSAFFSGHKSRYQSAAALALYLMQCAESDLILCARKWPLFVKYASWARKVKLDELGRQLRSLLDRLCPRLLRLPRPARSQICHQIEEPKDRSAAATSCAQDPVAANTSMG
jgi:hypothetical protein